MDSFVSGPPQQVCARSGLAVARAEPGHNPLFIYGGPGLGKTHLLHAIGNYMAFSGARILLVSSEVFMNDFINSIRDDKAGAFRRYRHVDFLLIDDIQFLQARSRRSRSSSTPSTRCTGEAGGDHLRPGAKKKMSGFAERMRTVSSGVAHRQPPTWRRGSRSLRKKPRRTG